MSGRQFIETLRQLGYSKANSLDAQDFDWLFDNDKIVPFLDWFCNNVSSTNVLEPKDIKEYEKMISTEEGVLEGRQLEETLKSFSTVKEEEGITEGELKKMVSQLRSDLQIYKHRKQMLLQRRNKLSLHHTGLSHRLAKLSTVEAKVKAKYKARFQQSQTDNIEVNTSLDSLLQSVERLNGLYSTSSEQHFLSQLQFDEYANMEERFTQELTTFTKKLFFEGISEMTGQDEESRYKILDVSDPESLLIQGESEQVNISECKELARLQLFYPKSESSRIQALMLSKMAEQSVHCAENLLRMIETGDFGRDINKISENLQEKQHMLGLVSRDLNNMGEKEMPTLINESKVSQVSKVLTGDYNLKLTRQDYFISNQDQVISHLVEQRSRNEFLTMAFEIEAQGHRDVHRLLTAVQQFLEKQLSSWKARMDMMADPSLNPAKHQRGTVDSRDKFTTRLHQMIVDSDLCKEKQLFLTFNSLLEGAQRWKQLETSMEDRLVSARQRQENRLVLLESNLNSFQEMVYAGSSTTSGQPCLTPLKLIQTMNQLDDMLKKLEQTIKDVVKDLESKKQNLKSDTFLQNERKILTCFYTNTEQLDALFDELSSRLQAQRVH